MVVFRRLSMLTFALNVLMLKMQDSSILDRSKKEKEQEYAAMYICKFQACQEVNYG